MPRELLVQRFKQLLQSIHLRLFKKSNINQYVLVNVTHFKGWETSYISMLDLNLDKLGQRFLEHGVSSHFKVSQLLNLT